MQNCDSPIFIGGTGRSGTTIMGKYLDSHRDLTTPVHENKLIVEHGGLRSLIDNLSSGYDYKSNHYAITSFMEWAKTLRKRGFKSSAVDLAYRALNKLFRITTGHRINSEKVCRTFPFLDFSLASVGDKFGYDHYDQCIDQFLSEIIAYVDHYGIFDTEGLIKPVYSSRTTNREKLIACARKLLRD